MLIFVWLMEIKWKWRFKREAQLDGKIDNSDGFNYDF